MNEHVVSYQDSGHPDGMVGVLAPHRHGAPLDWTDDGVTCAPAIPCSAISEGSDARCLREAVVLVFARTKYSRVDSATHDVFLCGGHFDVHRSARDVRVLVTPARAR